MIRHLTRAEAIELIEGEWNYDGAAADCGNGLFEFTLLNADNDEVHDAVAALTADDIEGLRVIPDHTEGMSCLTITIQTKEIA